MNTLFRMASRIREAYRMFVRRHIVAPEPQQPQGRIRMVVVKKPVGFETGFRVLAHNEYEAAEILWLQYLDMRPWSARPW